MPKLVSKVCDRQTFFCLFTHSTWQHDNYVKNQYHSMWRHDNYVKTQYHSMWRHDNYVKNQCPNAVIIALILLSLEHIVKSGLHNTVV